ncbi:hypothetical protein, partial [Photobacterium leiognathi]|uniref:hypothetical protein n=1 Tax=Photobacterium leiognathi TaxID=553611 RepID=UPI0027339224
GLLSIITLKTTMHLKRKRLLPKGNNKYRGKVYRERKGEQKQKASTVGDDSEGGERELVLVAISG